MSGMLMDLSLPAADAVVHNSHVLFTNQSVMSINKIVQWFNAVKVIQGACVCLPSFISLCVFMCIASFFTVCEQSVQNRYVTAITVVSCSSRHASPGNCTWVYLIGSVG